MTIKNYYHKKIGIVGLGKTGLSIVKKLHDIVNNIIGWDDNLKQLSHNNIDQYPKLTIEQISHEKWEDLDIIFISPGIIPSHPIFQFAQKNSILISSDIQLFLELNCNSNIVLVTGTNGKTTTVSLINHIIQKSEIDYAVGGNIGIPVLSLIDNKKGYILEISSFQIELLNIADQHNVKINSNYIRSINAVNISTILNITPDHLDRHESFQKYYEIKTTILNHNGIKIINTEQPLLKTLYNNYLASEGDKIIAINKNIIDPDTGKQILYKTCLIGEHNKNNISAAFTICSIIGIQKLDIINHISSFNSLKHRMEFLGKINNINFYNDSKATNVEATIKALSSLNNIYWLAGGEFKEKELFLSNQILSHIKKAYFFGKSKMLFAEYLKCNIGSKIKYEIFDSMQDAFCHAIIDINTNKQCNTEQSNILLSPACASFDQFKNFEDRGNQFIKLYQLQLTQ